MKRKAQGNGRTWARAWRGCLAAAALVALVGMPGCGGAPRLDASSEEACRASVRQMADSLPAAERERFQKAVLKLSFKGVAKQALAGEDQPRVAEYLRPFHGMTAQEMIDQAAAVKL